MEQRLFILLFFTGVVPVVLPVSRKYILIQQEKTWSDAQAYCRVEHTDLAIIKTNEELVQLQSEAQRQQLSSNAWIGLYNDINSWRWSLGNESLENIRFWKTNQPDNWLGDEPCGAISGSVWIDGPCSAQAPFVCVDVTKTGNARYIYISNGKTWSEAQAYCRSYHTDLASARDATENSVIGGLTSRFTWFGLFRDTWKWIDQTNFSTSSWISLTLDNALGNEDCGYLSNNQAADAPCSNIMPFFCYSVITGKQQNIRVKVQTSQDANDPAVKAVILEQIKQELKDHGITENITVKWREQRDGKVFHKEEKKNSTEKRKSGCFSVS